MASLPSITLSRNNLGDNLGLKFWKFRNLLIISSLLSVTSVIIFLVYGKKSKDNIKKSVEDKTLTFNKGNQAENNSDIGEKLSSGISDYVRSSSPELSNMSSASSAKISTPVDEGEETSKPHDKSFPNKFSIPVSDKNKISTEHTILSASTDKTTTSESKEDKFSIPVSDKNRVSTEHTILSAPTDKTTTSESKEEDDVEKQIKEKSIPSNKDNRTESNAIISGKSSPVEKSKDEKSSSQELSYTSSFGRDTLLEDEDKRSKSPELPYTPSFDRDAATPLEDKDERSSSPNSSYNAPPSGAVKAMDETLATLISDPSREIKQTVTPNRESFMVELPEEGEGEAFTRAAFESFPLVSDEEDLGEFYDPDCIYKNLQWVQPKSLSIENKLKPHSSAEENEYLWDYEQGNPTKEINWEDENCFIALNIDQGRCYTAPDITFPAVTQEEINNFPFPIYARVLNTKYKIKIAQEGDQIICRFYWASDSAVIFKTKISAFLGKTNFFQLTDFQEGLTHFLESTISPDTVEPEFYYNIIADEKCYQIYIVKTETDPLCKVNGVTTHIPNAKNNSNDIDDIKIMNLLKLAPQNLKLVMICLTVSLTTIAGLTWKIASRKHTDKDTTFESKEDSEKQVKEKSILLNDDTISRSLSPIEENENEYLWDYEQGNPTKEINWEDKKISSQKLPSTPSLGRNTPLKDEDETPPLPPARAAKAVDENLVTTINNTSNEIGERKQIPNQNVKPNKSPRTREKKDSSFAYNATSSEKDETPPPTLDRAAKEADKILADIIAGFPSEIGDMMTQTANHNAQPIKLPPTREKKDSSFAYNATSFEKDETPPLTPDRAVKAVDETLATTINNTSNEIGETQTADQNAQPIKPPRKIKEKDFNRTVSGNRPFSYHGEELSKHDFGEELSKHDLNEFNKVYKTRPYSWAGEPSLWWDFALGNARKYKGEDKDCSISLDIKNGVFYAGEGITFPIVTQEEISTFSFPIEAKFLDTNDVIKITKEEDQIICRLVDASHQVLIFKTKISNFSENINFFQLTDFKEELTRSLESKINPAHTELINLSSQKELYSEHYITADKKCYQKIYIQPLQPVQSQIEKLQCQITELITPNLNTKDNSNDIEIMNSLQLSPQNLKLVMFCLTISLTTIAGLTWINLTRKLADKEEEHICDEVNPTCAEIGGSQDTSSTNLPSSNTAGGIGDTKPTEDPKYSTVTKPHPAKAEPTVKTQRNSQTQAHPLSVSQLEGKDGRLEDNDIHTTSRIKGNKTITSVTKQTNFVEREGEEVRTGHSVVRERTKCKNPASLTPLLDSIRDDARSASQTANHRDNLPRSNSLGRNTPQEGGEGSEQRARTSSLNEGGAQKRSSPLKQNRGGTLPPYAGEEDKEYKSVTVEKSTKESELAVNMKLKENKLHIQLFNLQQTLEQRGVKEIEFPFKLKEDTEGEYVLKIQETMLTIYKIGSEIDQLTNKKPEKIILYIPLDKQKGEKSTFIQILPKEFPELITEHQVQFIRDKETKGVEGGAPIKEPTVYRFVKKTSLLKPGINLELSHRTNESITKKPHIGGEEDVTASASGNQPNIDTSNKTNNNQKIINEEKMTIVIFDTKKLENLEKLLPFLAAGMGATALLVLAGFLAKRNLLNNKDPGKSIVRKPAEQSRRSFTLTDKHLILTTIANSRYETTLTFVDESKKDLLKVDFKIDDKDDLIIDIKPIPATQSNKIVITPEQIKRDEKNKRDGKKPTTHQIFTYKIKISDLEKAVRNIGVYPQDLKSIIKACHTLSTEETVNKKGDRVTVAKEEYTTLYMESGTRLYKKVGRIPYTGKKQTEFTDLDTRNAIECNWNEVANKRFIKLTPNSNKTALNEAFSQGLMLALMAIIKAKESALERITPTPKIGSAKATVVHEGVRVRN